MLYCKYNGEQEKTMGKRRSKRLFPVKYASDYINTNKGIDIVKVDAHQIFQNKNRIRSTVGRGAGTTPVLNNTFTQPIPATKHISAYDPEHDVYIPSPRRITLEAKMHSSILSDRSQTFLQNLEHWTGTLRMSGYVQWNYFKVGGLRLYFQGNKWVFVNIVERELFYSKTYDCKATAMEAHKRGKIFWADVYILPEQNTG